MLHRSSILLAVSLSVLITGACVAEEGVGNSAAESEVTSQGTFTLYYPFTTWGYAGTGGEIYYSIWVDEHQAHVHFSIANDKEATVPQIRAWGPLTVFCSDDSSARAHPEPYDQLTGSDTTVFSTDYCPDGSVAVTALWEASFIIWGS